jgi:hypothetical protein
MSTKIITKKIKRKLIIEEDEFDITRLRVLPQSVVDYCFSFLSTPETQEQKKLGCVDGMPLYQNGSLDTELMKKYQDACDKWYSLTEEQRTAWRNRPAVWWKKMVKTETERMWNEKYVPVLTERFKKMKAEKLQDLTAGLDIREYDLSVSLLEFRPHGNRNQSKKDWMEHKLRITPTKELNRTFCLNLIMLSKGLRPRQPLFKNM